MPAFSNFGNSPFIRWTPSAPVSPAPSPGPFVRAPWLVNAGNLPLIIAWHPTQLPRPTTSTGSIRQWTVNPGNLPFIHWFPRHLNQPTGRHNQWTVNQGNLPLIWWWRNCRIPLGATGSFSVEPLITALFLTPAVTGAFSVQPLITASFLGNRGSFSFQVRPLITAGFLGYHQVTTGSFSVRPLIKVTFTGVAASSGFKVQPLITARFSTNAGQQTTCITTGSTPEGGGTPNAVY